MPVIGCKCSVCTSTDPKDNRLRCSALLTAGNKNYLIDVGPDFRQQALREGLSSLEAVFLTHAHADHIHGLDDLRIFSHKNSRAMNEEKYIRDNFPDTEGEGLPIYTSSRTSNHIRSTFQYIFVDHDKGGGIPKLHFISVDDNSSEHPVLMEGLRVTPIPMMHGNYHTTGWVFTKVSGESCKNSIAYLTDCNFISESSLEEVKKAGGNIKHLIIDALRKETHSSHNSFDQALAYADVIGAKHTWFTHMTHNSSHEEIQKYIDDNLSAYRNLSSIVADGGSVSPAYDGLSLIS